MHRDSLVNRLFSRYAAFLCRHPWYVLVIAVAFSIAGGFAATRLKVDADLTKLVPDDFASVQNLAKLERVFGGIGYLIIAVESPDMEAAKRFAADYARDLEKNKDVLYVDWKNPVAWFEKRALLWMDAADIDTIHDRLKKKIKFEKKIANPLYVDLLGEKYELDFSDLEAKYTKKKKSDDKTKDSAKTGGASMPEYYIDKSGKMLVLLAKPASSASDLAFARRLIGAATEIRDRLDPKKYHPQMKVSFTGHFLEKLEENQIVTGDLKLSTPIGALLVIILTWPYFYRASRFAVDIPLFLAIAWAVGLTALLMGKISIVSAFLGVILIGLGIDFGIQLYASYRHERLGGRGIQEALEAMLHTTGRAIMTAGATTVAAFATLTLARFKGFSEFGLIATWGLLLTFIGMCIVVPAAIVVFERRGWLKFEADPVKVAPSHGPYPWAKLVLLVSLVATVLSVWGISRLTFEYDLSRLQAQGMKSKELQSKITELFSISMTPAVVICDNETDEKAVVAELKRRKEQPGSTIDMIQYLGMYVPDNQGPKAASLARLRKLLDDEALKKVKGQERRDLDRLRDMASATPYTRADLPWEIRRSYLPAETNSTAQFVQIFPNRVLSDGPVIRSNTREITGIKLEGGRSTSAVSTSLFLNDILDLIGEEGPLLLSLAFLFVVILVWLDFRRVGLTLVVIVPLVVGFLWMLGIMALFGVRFNFLNVSMLPIIFGMGVNQGVYVCHRYRDLGPGSIRQVIRRTYGPCTMSVVTALIGFGALATAHHSGLQSIATIPIIGLVTTLLVAFTLLPAALQWNETMALKRGRDVLGLLPNGSADIPALRKAVASQALDGTLQHEAFSPAGFGFPAEVTDTPEEAPKRTRRAAAPKAATKKPAAKKPAAEKSAAAKNKPATGKKPPKAKK